MKVKRLLVLRTGLHYPQVTSLVLTSIDTKVIVWPELLNHGKISMTPLENELPTCRLVPQCLYPTQY